ncbi:MAG: hypothetical protein ACK4IY_04390 [Chitinophagales bacterium]
MVNVVADTSFIKSMQSVNEANYLTKTADADSIEIMGNAYPLFNFVEEWKDYRQALVAEEKPGWMTLLLLRPSVKMATSDPHEISVEIFRKFLDNLPKVIFISFPVFALIYTFIYPQDYFYAEHFTLSVHFQAFLFPIFLIIIPVSIVRSNTWRLFMFLSAIY